MPMTPTSGSIVLPIMKRRTWAHARKFWGLHT